jgi:hypothetical protein
MFPVTETKFFQFRVEAFNIWNTPQFGPPSNTTWNTSTPGVTGSPTNGFGAITSLANSPRQLQLALKFYF